MYFCTIAPKTTVNHILMKKVLCAVLALCFGFAGFAALPILDPELRAEMSRRGDDEKTRINILMVEQSDPTALNRAAHQFTTKQERREFVVETLKQQAEVSQADLLALLEEMERNGMVDDIRPL